MEFYSLGVYWVYFVFLTECNCQEQMDILSHLCDDRYLSLIEGESGNALLDFHLQSSNTAGVVSILRQDHPEVSDNLTVHVQILAVV